MCRQMVNGVQVCQVIKPYSQPPLAAMQKSTLFGRCKGGNAYVYVHMHIWVNAPDLFINAFKGCARQSVTTCPTDLWICLCQLALYSWKYTWAVNHSESHQVSRRL